LIDNALYWHHVQMSDTQRIQAKYHGLARYLDEAALRVWAAVEARAIGRGGVSRVAHALGISRNTVYAGMRDLESTPDASAERLSGASGKRRIRAPGGGRKKLTDKDSTLLADLDALVEPTARGDPTSPLRWSCKSTSALARQLKRMGHTVSPRSVSTLLADLGYRLQSVRKAREGRQHPDRDTQFRHIADETAAYQAAGAPVIAVDTKKKELVGDFKNPGREWQPQGEPERVRVHDFKDPDLGKVAPYGVYDIAANQGWVSVGVDHDTAQFAVESIRRWWVEMGQWRYPDADHLMITADCGASNGPRQRLWRVELQQLADELNRTIRVCHFPPGTSKWNKIEHRMFCHITQNWRGRPLTSREVVVELIGHTTTQKGLRIQAQLDINRYETGIKIPQKTLDELAIERDAFHGDWNYRLHPRTASDNM
jgi:hypothetical protein